MTRADDQTDADHVFIKQRLAPEGLSIVAITCYLMGLLSYLWGRLGLGPVAVG